MKSIKLLALVAGVLLTQSAAAFITVIDVHDVPNRVTTIQAGTEVSVFDLVGKHMTYRGQAREAVSLFEKIVRQEWPEEITKISHEIHPVSGTIVMTVKTSGWIGVEISHYVIKSNGP